MLVKSISDLEQQVMNILWMKQESSVREILLEIEKKKKVAYTTVATILQRLYKKGLISKKKKGNTLMYLPLFTKESYSRILIQSVFKKFINSFGDMAITSFAESIDTLSKEKKDMLLELLQKNDKK